MNGWIICHKIHIQILLFDVRLSEKQEYRYLQNTAILKSALTTNQKLTKVKAGNSLIFYNLVKS